jgi:iron complex outermembrane recepter protein
MIIRKSALHTALLAALACGTSGIALAQSEAVKPSDEQVGLGEIIVTATKRSENLQDVPVSISAIGNEQLASRGVTTSNDLGAVVPNLQVSSQYGETSPNFSLRGVGVANEFTANTASPIGVYVDEVSQTFRYTHGLSLYDLERVEVLRGPQGTLFGRNTTGGAINLITRQPKLGDTNGYLTVGYGNYDRYKLQGAFEVTPVEDKVGLRVAFNRGSGDGYFSDPFKADTTYGSLDTLGLRATLRLKPSEQLNISIKGFYSKDDPVGYPLHYLGLNGADANGNGGFDNQGNTRQTAACCTYDQVALDSGGIFLTKNYGGALNINYDISDNWSITSVTGYTKSRFTMNIDNDATPLNQYTILYDSKGEDFSQDFRVNYTSDAFKGLLGVYYGKDSILSNNEVTVFGFSPTPFNVNFGYNQKRKTVAVYGEGTYSLTPQLELTLGGRYTHDNADFLDAFSNVVTGFPGTVAAVFYNQTTNPETVIRQSYSNWSGRAILNYAWTDDIKTYVSYSRGYRSGTFNGFGFISSTAVYFVVPERLDSIEAGFKARFAGNTIQLNGAAFHYDYRNQQVQEVIGGVAFLRSLDSKVKGAELELLAKPVSALTLRGSLGFLDTNYTAINALTKLPQQLSGKSVAGNEVPFASKWTLSAGGDLTVARIAEGDLVLSGEVVYKSSIWFDPFNDKARPNAASNIVGTAGNLYKGPNGETNLVGSKGYALVNAGLAWNSENVQVRVWGKNITNKQYYPFGYDTAGAFGTVLLTPGTPRTYGIEATLKFGGSSGPSRAPAPPEPLPVVEAAPAPVAVVEAAPPPPPPPAPGPFIVFFDWNKSVVTPEAASILQASAKAYKETGQARINLSGHADKSGTDVYNEALSTRRSEAVKAYLIGQGVPADAIAASSFGEGKPLVETADGVREPQNRRVEITF